MREIEKTPTKKKLNVWVIVGFLGVIAALIVALIWNWQPLYDLFSNSERIRQLVADAGPWGPLVFILLQVVQVIVAPIPGQAVGFVSGFLFGTWWGTLYTMVGAAIGFTLIFIFARKLGRPFVEHFADKKHIDKFDYFTNSNNGVFALFLVFLLPAFPDDIICYIAGLSKIKISTLIIISLLGRLPGYLVLNFAGAGIAEAKIEMVAIIFSVVMIISAVGIWQRKNLERFVKHFAKR